MNEWQNVCVCVCVCVYFTCEEQTSSMFFTGKEQTSDEERMY